MRRVVVGDFLPWNTDAFAAAVDAGCEYELVIDSDGGDVIELQRIKQLIEERGKPAAVVVRTACSCGANLLAWLAARGVECRCYDSAVVFFHSARCNAETEAELNVEINAVKAFNDSVRADLLALGMAADMVETCLAGEGRWFIGSAAIIAAGLCAGVVNPAFSAYCGTETYTRKTEILKEDKKVVKSAMQRRIVGFSASAKSFVIHK